MKKTIAIIGLLVIGLFIVSFSAIRAMADENVLGVQTLAVNPIVDEKQALLEAENNYYLAYPGILPDHPIYWMKMLRDKVIETLESNEMKKVELWMNFADKRLGGAKVLIEGNQKELGIQTATKANGYLHKAVLKLEELKKENVNVGDIANRMERETLKHAQVLNSLGKSESGDVTGKLNGLRDEGLKLHSRVEVVLGR